ncbi:nicotinamide mononucleotide transporter [Actinocrinis puniceicyclus]|uniref:Nicotinamide mononucleotide transporter n=1 Tax=Actinocrinis puniceicyclus TaxID=977794 RepID=A0A8J8BDD9_9ACTN|nr:nicotinamide mononucleotide transporter family protein [Actinocrinis puniceicyclus]MBS2966127.1 nicotinamide mononucleotide transporter [Actinocrinis puniceicyclus]
MNHLFGWADLVAFRLGGETVRWSDLLGNLLGLATVALALRRSLWTWPVQITGAVLLLGADMAVHLGGTAARQLAVIALAGYGWARWRRAGDAAAASGPGGAVRVRWAGWTQRALLLAAIAAGTGAFAWLLSATHSSWNPLPDAYIFIGTLAATLAQGRGWVEFWLVWIAVDVVGVPLAFHSGLPVSGFTYVVYFALVLAGLRQWARLAGSGGDAAAPAPGSAPASVTPSAAPTDTRTAAEGVHA